VTELPFRKLRPDAKLPAFEFGHSYAVTGRSLLAFGLATEGPGATLDTVAAPPGS